MHVDPLRVVAIAAASPVIKDALLAGYDKPYVALLARPNLEACRQTAGRPQATADELIRDAAVCSACARACMRTTRPSLGSSLRFQRAMLMSEPPTIDGN